jgi:peptidoglycan/LPS O-acetylase OafA/YrhL
MSKPWRNPRLVGRIKELDGLRGLAILLVLVQHYVGDTVYIDRIDWRAYALFPFRFAWSGVDLFFVLSGFLIGGALIDAKPASNYYSTFYMRRIHRIVPLYYLWLILFGIGLYFSVGTKAGFVMALFRRAMPFWTYPLFVQNFAMSARNGVGATWLGITWSLAVEEQFYLLLPVIIRYSGIKTIVRLACAAIIIAPVLRFALLRSGTGLIAPYTLLPCRADALAFGVIIAVVLRTRVAWTWLESHRKQIYLAFSFLSIGVCSLLFVRQPLTKPLFVSLGFSVLAAFYASLLVLVIVNPGRIERLAFGWNPLVRLGIISYAVYIIHQGVNFLWHGVVFGRLPSLTDWPSILLTLVSFLTVLMLAGLSWRFMEGPLIRRAHNRYRYRDGPVVSQTQPASDQEVSGIPVRSATH